MPGSTLLFINLSKFGEKGKTGRDMHENNRKNKEFKFSQALKKYWTKITLFIEHYKPQQIHTIQILQNEKRKCKPYTMDNSSYAIQRNQQSMKQCTLCFNLFILEAPSYLKVKPTQQVLTQQCCQLQTWEVLEGV